jgi:hypothetical protein
MGSIEGLARETAMNLDIWVALTSVEHYERLLHLERDDGKRKEIAKQRKEALRRLAELEAKPN